MNIEMNLPQTVYFDTFGELMFLERNLKSMNKDIKIYEIGYIGQDYIGIVYFKKQDDSFKKLKRYLKSLKNKKL
jgi:hypothetical protein